MGKRAAILAGLFVAAIAVAVGLYLFQPWRIFTSSTVTEDIPSAAPAAAPSQEATAEPSAPAASATPDAPAGPAAPAAPRELATGQLISHEHASSGTVRILELADGSRILRLEGLDTSDGPDLKVWLSDAPVIEGLAGGTSSTTAPTWTWARSKLTKAIKTTRFRPQLFWATTPR